MKNTRYLILILGVLGSIACGYNIVLGEGIATNVFGFISGSSLVWGFFELENTPIKS
ncbi:hypothetical protein ACFSTE_10385 [Aquimarina hainanensis]|uniref:Uncharacterized protein n=1 Tax=Aquimarina hainanensis TaxID=1578017 RepID=A0ABW5N7W7_9FLAO|nr:hypothetical protein [Aquimarina sp. TRL1]QKX05722.1 hypothetical protein HN014_12650 [Aquimarina sp. TRL1]